MSVAPVLTREESVVLQQRIRAGIERRRLELYRPYPKQQLFHKNGSVYRERLLRAGNQIGKELRYDEPVLTPIGWIQIDNLRVGDEVIAGDGSITTVTGVFPQGVKPLMELEFCYGQKIVCGFEHLWKVLEPKARWTTSCKNLPRINGKRKTVQIPNNEFESWKVITAGEMRRHYGDNPSPKYRYATPAVGVTELSVKPVAIDPYVMGILIGDGGLTNGIVLSSGDQSIVDAVKSETKRLGGQFIYRNRYDYKIIKCPLMTQALADSELLGVDSSGKRVPPHYLWNSPAVRLAILQGLMDTDGTCEKGGTTTFTSVSKGLAEDVVFLARSFGGKCHIMSRIPTFTYKGVKKQGQRAYTVMIRLPHVPIFRLERKLKRYIRPTSTTDHNLIVSYRDVEPAQAYCISVAHPDKTYVVRDFIVTHNTLSAAAETAIHATGRYPSWWQGRRFTQAPVIWAGGVTGEVTRDTIQRLLIGSVGQPGTGFIPPDDIIETSPSRGVADLVDTILVKHSSGGTTRIRLKYYEQGREKWQGDTVNVVWLDEEPDIDIYLEALTRTNATGGMIYLTFTPLKGMSEVVRRFLVDSSVDRCDVNMTIEDALHIPEAERQRIIESYPVHERSARIKGTPTLGSGRIFPISDEDIMCDPFDISAVPFFWLEIAGLDFGWDHPTAAAKALYNPQDDIIYITNTYKRKEATPIIHAAALRSWGKNVPWAWPHDGLQHDKGSGEQLCEAYRKQGLNMLAERAMFEDGSNGVEAGIAQMLMRMETGRFKVFAHLADWFEEFRLYHRKEGKVVKEYDDLMACTRYLVMCLRFAARVRKAGGMINGWPIEESEVSGRTRHTYDYNPLSREICRGIRR